MKKFYIKLIILLISALASSKMFAQAIEVQQEFCHGNPIKAGETCESGPSGSGSSGSGSSGSGSSGSGSSGSGSSGSDTQNCDLFNRKNEIYIIKITKKEPDSDDCIFSPEDEDNEIGLSHENNKLIIRDERDNNKAVYEPDLSSLSSDPTYISLNLSKEGSYGIYENEKTNSCYYAREGLGNFNELEKNVPQDIHLFLSGKTEIVYGNSDWDRDSWYDRTKNYNYSYDIYEVELVDIFTPVTFCEVKVTSKDILITSEDDEGKDFCLDNDDQININIKLSLGDNKSEELKIVALKSINDGHEIIKSISLKNKSEITNDDWGFDNTYVGKKIYFELSQKYKNRTFTDRIGPYEFTLSLPHFNVEDIVERSACDTRIKIEYVDESLVSPLSSYEYTLKQIVDDDDDDDVSLINLTLYNNTTLITKQNLDVENGSNYKLTIRRPNSPYCAYEKEFTIPAKPEALTISGAAAVVKNPDGITKYHISKNGTSDGEIEITFNNDNLDLINSISSITMEEVTVDNNDDSTTGQITHTFTVSPNNKNSISLTGLSAGTYKDIKVFYYGKSNCSATLDSRITLKQPEDLLLGDITASTVCHENNSETTSGSNGVISGTFSGGVGNYKVELYRKESIEEKIIEEKIIEEKIIEEKIIEEKIIEESILSYDFNFSPVGVGEYIVKITDLYGSSKEITDLYESSKEITDLYEVFQKSEIKVTSNPEIILSADPTPLTCFEKKDGKIQLTATDIGGDGTTTYTLVEKVKVEGSDETTSEEKTEPPLGYYEGLSAGIYTATVTNSLGCTDIVNNIEVTQPEEISITATGSKIARHGENTGTIDLVFSGLQGNFDYTLYKGKDDDTEKISEQNINIEDGTTSNTAIEGLEHGNYKVEVTDVNKCSQTLDNIIIQQPEAPLELSAEITHVLCNGDDTGEVNLTATGGWGEYKYNNNKENYISSKTFSVLKAGQYTFSVKDAEGGTEELSITISEPTKLISSIDKIDNLKCFEDNSGAVKLNISGGTPGYKIKTDNTDWVDGNSLSDLSKMDNEPIYVSDANNCDSEVDVTITQPDKIAIAEDKVINALCNENNGSIEVSVNGGTINENSKYQYVWTKEGDAKFDASDAQNSIKSIKSGKYNLTVTDDNGCEATLEDITISDTDGPEITSFQAVPVSCHGGSDGKIIIENVEKGTPDYRYFLDNDERSTNTFSGLGSKVYQLTVKDANGCQYFKEITIDQPEQLNIKGESINPICHDSDDGFIKPIVEGGTENYSFNWSNNQTSKNVEKLNSGTFILTVTDDNGCTTTESFEVVPPEEPSANFEQKDWILCTGNTLEFDGGNFTSYEWYQNDVRISENRYLTVGQSGNYRLEITNEMGCKGIDFFDLEVSDTPLDANMLLQDSAMVDEKVRVVDVTWPAPNKIEWLYNYPVETTNNNDYSQEFSFNEEATIDVTLRAWYDGCFSDLTRTILIYSEETIIFENQENDDEPLILSYKAFPNPNNGRFSVSVDLSRQADISLFIYNFEWSSSDNAVAIKHESGKSSYLIPFDLTGLASGMYYVVLIANGEQQRLRIIII